MNDKKSEIALANVRNMLNKVSDLKDQDDKIRRIKGEDFNLFSIMRMETDENNTHSNIIAELLNPNGSHHLGNTFLKLFLEIIYTNQTDASGKPKVDLNIDLLLKNTQPKVFTEYHIGFKDDILKTGGRIDILIEFGDQHTISIENKINAIDQKLQLKRYNNFRKGKNDVFYLTKNGAIASKGSLDDLTEDHIYSISYENHIKNWMQLSIQAAAEQPILRESLKQYLLLIKKLTFQMEDELRQQMVQLLKTNLRTASTIYHNYFDAKRAIQREIKNEVFEKLEHLVPKYNLQIINGGDVNSRFSQIWIQTRGVTEPKVSFGIESFSGDPKSNYGGQMMVGIFNVKGTEDIALEIYPDCKEWYPWPDYILLTNSNSNPLNLWDLPTLELFLNPKTRDQNILIIVEATVGMIEKYYELVNRINLRA